MARGSVKDRNDEWKKLVALTGAIHDVSSKVGFPSKDPGAEAGKKSTRKKGKAVVTEISSEVSVLDVAMWNEFGTPDAKHPIPARPFLRTTTDRYRSQIGILKSKALSKLIDRAAAGEQVTKADVGRELGIVGEYLTGKIKLAIRDWSEPANSETTQAAKGAKVGPGVMVNNPLVDTGQMMQSVTHVETV